jgi:glycosyltransferase involved in cell wall biosynthesis
LSGAQQRIHWLIKSLCDEHVVDVVIGAQRRTVPPDDWVRTVGCRSLSVIEEDVPDPRHDPLWGRVPGAISAMAKAAVRQAAPPIIEYRRPRNLQRQLATLPERYDAIVAIRMWVAEAVLASRREPVILDYDDSEAELLEQGILRSGHYKRSALHHLQLIGLRRYEANLPRRHAAVAVVREEDRRRWRDPHDRNVIVVPNGIDIPARRRRAPRHDRILFVGAFFHYPNLEALEWLMKQVMPIVWRTRPDVQVIAAGRRPIPDGWHWLRTTPGLQCMESPDELSDLYDTAGVVVAPIQSGSGTKIKVLEALANGAPLVATAAATHGIPVIPSKHYVRAESPDAFANACLTVLDDPVGAASMCDAGFDLVAQYSWGEIGHRFSQAVARVVDSGGSAPAV